MATTRCDYNINMLDLMTILSRPPDDGADHVRPGGQFRRLHAVSPAACMRTLLTVAMAVS